MKHVSKDINLADQTYTNHYIQATVLNTVGEKYAARHIMCLCGHKNESGIKQYAVKCPENKRKKKKEIFNTLIQILDPTENDVTETETVRNTTLQTIDQNTL